METLTIIAGVLLLILLVSQIQIGLQISKLRKRGLYPLNEKQATMADVERLLNHGERNMAIRLYRMITPRASLREASDQVKKLERQSTSA